MSEQPAGEKTLPASQRKIDQAREKGNVPKSQDLNSSALLLTALLGLSFLGPSAMEQLMLVMQYYLSESYALITETNNIQAMLVQVLFFVAPIVLPLMFFLMVAGIAINISQFGVLVSSQALMPKLERLNPIKGFQKFVSIRSFVELIKSVSKLTLIGFIAYLTIKGRTPELLTLMHRSPVEGTLIAWGILFTVWWRVGFMMLILGLLDYGFQRWQHGQDLRMTQQEMKQEMKQYDGNPEIKQRIRAIQRQMSMNRMMADLPEADVVITNPTTYAVALRFNPMEMNAPIVIAKGARLTAERIRDIASEHEIPLVERPPLARALFRTLEVGQAVPEDLFRGVAEVLAYIYEIDRREEKLRERKHYHSAAMAHS
jgi:flagellar biosynthesis protein FlhB